MITPKYYNNEKSSNRLVVLNKCIIFVACITSLVKGFKRGLPFMRLEYRIYRTHLYGL